MISFIFDFMALFSIYLILTLSLNLDAGYCGIPDFGKVLPMAGGAFTVSLFAGRIATALLGIEGDFINDNSYVVTQINSKIGNNPLLCFVSLLTTLIVAMGFGAALGYLFTRPAIKRGVGPLALLTLAAGEAIRIIGYNYNPLAGGSVGVSAPDVFVWGGRYRFAIASIILLVVGLLVFFYVNRLTNSPLGRTLRAIRDDEDAACSLGIDTTKIRLKTIMISSSIASLAGALYAFYSGAVISSAYTRASWSFVPWAMMLLGGMANNLGVTVGVLSLISIRELIIIFKHPLSPFIPFDILWFELIIYGIAIILILLYRPQGILREKPTPTLKIQTIEKMHDTFLNTSNSVNYKANKSKDLGYCRLHKLRKL
jgi:branched-chain amino acid transport system permease protein